MIYYSICMLEEQIKLKEDWNQETLPRLVGVESASEELLDRAPSR